MESQIMNDEIARVARAMGHPMRVRILDVLAQGERNVDELSRRLATPLTTLSSQLKVLREARLVTTRREGTKIHYAVADPSILKLLLALRSVAEHRSAEVQRVVFDFVHEIEGLEAVTAAEMAELIDLDKVAVIDVRPRDEYDAGHIPGAISVPLDQLRQRARKFPRGQQIVAYCRDAYCVLAPEAVRELHQLGFGSSRLEIGFTEWAAEQHPIAREA